jgi:hypothetical protein
MHDRREGKSPIFDPFDFGPQLREKIYITKPAKRTGSQVTFAVPCATSRHIAPTAPRSTGATYHPQFLRTGL